MKVNPLKLQYDQLVLNIEFLLISVIQGVAFGTLVNTAIPLISTGKFEYWTYIFTGLMFILIYWSHAIIHAISFIDWPIDITHSLLYFVTSFFEVIVISQMMDPSHWYLATAILFLTGEILYIFDLHLIREREKNFGNSPRRKILFKHIMQRHWYELAVLIPFGIIFNFAIWYLSLRYEHQFIQQKYHLIFSVLQAFFALLMLISALHSFKKRTRLINEVIDKA